MRILFIGPYRQTDGWGNASKEYVRALKTTNHDITCCPIYLNGQTKFEEFNEFNDLENSKYDDYDVIIQNSLPSNYVKYGAGKNVGLAYFESSIMYTPWVDSINTLDEMWVPSFFEKDILQKSGITIPITNIGLPIDAKKYGGDETLGLLDEYKHEFKFYFVGEFIERKNLDALVVAFHTEFYPNEPVRLVIKTNKMGVSSSETYHQVSDHIANLKSRMGIYRNINNYKREVIITDYLSDEDMRGLHNDCHCFVAPSRGEAFCMPLMEAFFSNSFVLSNQHSGIPYNHHHNARLIKANKVPCMVSDRPIEFLYTARDYWYEVDIFSLREEMRKAYEEYYSIDKNKTKVEERYSYETIGKKIDSLL